MADDNIGGIKAQNRKLLAENKRLKRQVEQLRAELNKYHAYKPEEKKTKKEKLKVVKKEEVCPNCQGSIQETDIGVKTLITCESCTWRKTKANKKTKSKNN